MSEKKELKKWMILILFTAFSFLVVNNISVILGILKKLFLVIKPFVLGGVLAFILNIVVTKIENFLNKKLKITGPDTSVRITAIILSLLGLVTIIGFVAFLLIPELIRNIELLLENIPGLIQKTQDFVLDLLVRYPEIQVEIAEMFNQASISSILSTLLNYIINGSIGFISSLVSGVVSFVTAIIFAIYVLSQKESLKSGAKKILYAYFKEDKIEKILNFGRLTNKTFTSFISGQCLEAIILGTIFFIVLMIFRFPYALLISVLITITALVPIFGAFLACAVGAILIAVNSPIQAVIFVGIFLIIQQIEENFIYPKVVGASVGLSPMWTLFAISVGGSLYGILGMLIGLPIASIGYVLLKENTDKRLKRKKIKEII